jgi:hypothetical protein
MVTGVLLCYEATTKQNRPVTSGQLFRRADKKLAPLAREELIMSVYKVSVTQEQFSTKGERKPKRKPFSLGQWHSLIALSLFFTLFFTETAAAQIITAEPAQGPPGTGVTVKGTGWPPGDSIEIAWNFAYSNTVASVKADGNGAFTANVTLPQDAPIGPTYVDAGDQSAFISGQAPFNAQKFPDKGYVSAEQCIGCSPFQSFAHGVGGLFTEPTSLPIQVGVPYEKQTDYTVGQLIIADTVSLPYPLDEYLSSTFNLPVTFKFDAIEYGWIVAPGTYHDDRPYLFLSLSKLPLFATVRDLCFIVPEGRPNPWKDFPNSKKITACPATIWHGLSNNFQPGDPVAANGAPMMYHVGYYAGNKAWWIQYGGEWIGYVDKSWWDDDFSQGQHLQWYGEVTYETNACIPMGNGLPGTNPGSASVSNMFYEVMEGNTSVGHDAEADMLPDANPLGWSANTESKNQKVNAFRYGGPGLCSGGIAR